MISFWTTWKTLLQLSFYHHHALRMNFATNSFMDLSVGTGLSNTLIYNAHPSCSTEWKRKLENALRSLLKANFYVIVSGSLLFYRQYERTALFPLSLASQFVWHALSFALSYRRTLWSLSWIEEMCCLSSHRNCFLAQSRPPWRVAFQGARAMSRELPP